VTRSALACATADGPAVAGDAGTVSAALPDLARNAKPIARPNDAAPTTISELINFFIWQSCVSAVQCGSAARLVGASAD
jgi:hypothetical protein